jgi:glycogen debranching enzyme
MKVTGTKNRKPADAVIQLENKFYISTNSSYADNRIKVLNHSDTFGIFDRWGDITPWGEAVQGVYHCGTRFISRSEFLLNGVRPVLLSSAIKEGNEIFSADLTNELFEAIEDWPAIPKGVLHIGRSKFLRDGRMYEQLEFRNFGGDAYSFEISLNFYGDFKDIFEIRGMKRDRRGEIFEIRHISSDHLRIGYAGLDNVERFTDVGLCSPPDEWDGENTALYDIFLKPHQQYVLEYAVSFGVGKSEPVIYSFAQAGKKMEEELHLLRREFAHIHTSNEQFNHWTNRSHHDLISLLAQTKDGRYPYAGVPWYNTAFGRDGIITAYETLWFAPAVAHDVLLFLARNQATERSTFSDSEPGKILHEMREGEMVNAKEIPFGKYYGSIDSTPLFIMLAGAYYRRTADIETIQKIWKNLLAALDWIDTYGDIDGDGFYEYEFNKENGLVNQGWKDSADSISYDNGELAQHPVALCEMQGYVYDAKLWLSMLASVLGEDELGIRLRNEALDLKKRFHHSFWDEELSMYVIALDGKKEPCRVRSSNAGHCLFSGIADEGIAERLVKNLLAEDMFSGWGIRTLSSQEKRYNPMSYHNGSVWPHDVSLIAAGFARYGFRKEARRLTSALFDASLFIENQRLPELFCGFTRRRGEGPTAYPVACSPQAWSVGAVFMLLEACLHMEINALDKKVIFRHPSLPGFMDNIIINGLELGRERVSLELHRYKGGIGLDVRNKTTQWDIMLLK